MSTERQLRDHVQLTHRPHPPRRAMRLSGLRVGILLGALMAAAGLVAASMLRVAVRGLG